MNRVAKQLAPNELKQLASRYYMALGQLGTTIEDVRYDPRARYQAIMAKWPWTALVNLGVQITQAVLGSKVVPPGQEKALELASRVFMSVRRAPNKPVDWFDKNYDRMNFIYDAATQWADKGTTDTEQKFTVGPFTVHNTLGLTGNDLAGIQASLHKAIAAIKGLTAHDITKVLYGDIMIVGNLQKGTVVAWYYPEDDVVYVRPFRNAGFNEIHSIVHELGHRYWRKFAPRTMKMAWMRHHDNVATSTPDYDMPKVGDPLPVTIKGVRFKKGEPKVTRETDHGYYFRYTSKDETEREMTVSKFTIANVMAEKARRASGFPTPYSAKNFEEHFCDALGLIALGQLKEPHLSVFRQIVEGAEPKDERMIAAGTYIQISRDDLETWLDTIHLHEKWYLQPNKAGVYILPLSEGVGVKLSSTIGTRDDAMGRGQASMQLALISRITGQVLNKKAQGQSHFARTTNWQKNWRDGIDRMRDAYIKAQGFYDALALIEDREAYKTDVTDKIEGHEGWQNHPVLVDLHNRVERGGILTTAQNTLLNKILAGDDGRSTRNPAPPNGHGTGPLPDETLLERMRALYRAAQNRNDAWLMDFLKSVSQVVKAGRALSPKQQEVLDKNFSRYRVATLAARYFQDHPHV